MGLSLNETNGSRKGGRVWLEQFPGQEKVSRGSGITIALRVKEITALNPRKERCRGCGKEGKHSNPQEVANQGGSFV